MVKFTYFEYPEKLAVFNEICTVCNKQNDCYKVDVLLNKDAPVEEWKRKDLTICLQCILENTKYELNQNYVDNFIDDFKSGKFEKTPSDLNTKVEELRYRTPPIGYTWQGNLSWPFCIQCQDFMIFLGYPWPADLDNLAKDGDGLSLLKNLVHDFEPDMDEEVAEYMFKQIHKEVTEEELRKRNYSEPELNELEKMSDEEWMNLIREGKDNNPYAIFLFQCKKCNKLSLYVDWD